MNDKRFVVLKFWIAVFHSQDHLSEIDDPLLSGNGWGNSAWDSLNLDMRV